MSNDQEKIAKAYIVGSAIRKNSLELDIRVSVAMRDEEEKESQKAIPEDLEFIDPLGTQAIGAWNLVKTDGVKGRGIGHRVIVVGGTVFVGGEFDGLRSRDGKNRIRKNLAAFNRETGEPISFAPIVDGDVRALALSEDGSTLYVGGGFDSVNNEPRSKIAAFDTKTLDLLPFSTPLISRPIRALTVHSGKLYAGGLFNEVGSKSRGRVAAFDVETGSLDKDFYAYFDDRVTSIVSTEYGIFVGGAFEQVNGKKQRGLALITDEEGYDAHCPQAGDDVIDLAADKNNLYVAIGGPGGRAMCIDIQTMGVQWDIKSDGNFQAVSVDEGEFVYFGGHYESINGDKRADRLTRHYKKDGKMDKSWIPQLNGMRSTNAVYVDKNGIVVAGDFSRFGGSEHVGFAIANGATDR